MVAKRTAPAKSATNLFKQLQRASNRTPVFTGLIRKGNSEKSILFSLAVDGRAWQEIPVSAIERIHFVRPVDCGDETYPLVHLFMAAPKTSEGRAYAEVAAGHVTAASANDIFFTESSPLRVNLPPVPDRPCPHGERWVWDRAKLRWTCVAR